MFYDQNNLDVQEYTFNLIGEVTDDEYAFNPRCLLKYGDSKPVYILKVNVCDISDYAEIERLLEDAKRELESPYAEDAEKEVKQMVFPRHGTELILQSTFPFHWTNQPKDEDLRGRHVNIMGYLENGGTNIYAAPRNMIVMPEGYVYQELSEPDFGSNPCDDF